MISTNWKKVLTERPNPITISDIRRIDIRPEQSKIVKLLKFLEANELLDSRQAYYRLGHSTEIAFTAVTEDIIHATKKLKISILILSNFSKTFNFIFH